jgi:hypothetical protein
VVVAIVGLGSITGAIVAGVVYETLQKAVTTLPSRYAGLVAVIFGLATLSYTRHPEGFVDYLGGRFLALIGRNRRAARFLGGEEGDRAGGPPGADGPPGQDGLGSSDEGGLAPVGAPGGGS